MFPLKEFCKSKTKGNLFTIPPITILDVYNYLIRLKQTNTKDLDGLDGKILKLSAPVITDTLTYIYNLCLDKKYFPSKLKQAKVVPIHKSGNPSDPSNYRPISILSILSKPLERHIHSHLYQHLKDNDLLHENQSGFRENHSCHTALIQLVDKCLANINNNRFTGIIFADFSKAFDVISHPLLIRKLRCYHANEDSIDLFSSFLSDRKQTVEIDSKQSTFLPITHGIPQGSILGPLFFSIYINDLPLFTDSPCEMFADDTSMQADDLNAVNLTKKLQRNLDSLTDWTDLNHMSLNSVKTKAMFVTTRQKRKKMTSNFPALHIENKKVEVVKSHKVLGVLIDQDLSWSEHLSVLGKRISQKIYQLSKIKHFLDKNSRRLFFYAHIQSQINYASTLWDNASESNLKIIHRLYKRAIKLILLKSSSLIKDDYKSIGILPLKSRLDYSKYICMHNIINERAPRKIINNFNVNDNRHNHKLSFERPKNDLFKTSLTYSGAKL